MISTDDDSRGSATIEAFVVYGFIIPALLTVVTILLTITNALLSEEQILNLLKGKEIRASANITSEPWESEIEEDEHKIGIRVKQEKILKVEHEATFIK